MNEVLSYVDTHQKDFIESLNACLRIPSISVSPKHVEDVARCADFIAEKLKGWGLDCVEVFKTRRHPIVYGEWLKAPGQPTVLIYGHYDVQPVDPLNEWITPPFEPTLRNGELFARGAIDDKGQVYIHLSALEAFFKTRGKLPVNVKIFIEGEEEIGSPSLKDFLKKYKKLLKADTIVISDTPMLDKGMPSICYGLRGLCYMELEVTGPFQDLHSGVWGGVVDNPALALAKTLAQLKDKNGKVLIPGFYNDVRSLSAEEKKMLRSLPYSDKKFLKLTGAPALTGEKGYAPLERIWARPTLDVNGIFAGFSGEGSKTIIPAKAGAKVSMRLVPDQDPQKIARHFKKYIEKISSKTVRVKVTEHHGSKAFLEDIHQPILKVAQHALEKAFGKKTYFIREGGTIPFVRTVSEILNKPCVLLGFGLPDENAHAPNEKLNLENFHKGILSMVYFLEGVRTNEELG